MHYDVCDQDGCDGESGSAHTMSLVPCPMYPLPIGSTLCHAGVQWNQENEALGRDLMNVR